VSCYRIVLAEKARTPVSVACELFGVSTSGFYAWASRAPSDRELSDVWLIEKIKTIHAAKRGVYGSRRVTAELRLGDGIEVSRKRVQRLMRAGGLPGLVARKRGRTTIRVPGVRVADDLVNRRFRPAGPDVLWVADLTYLRTWEGWVYLAAIQDAFSRRIVGWSMAEHMRSELVVDALEMALHRRRPGPGLVHHSDQGSQFVSLAFGQKARDAGIAVSMGSKGCAYDNAVAESFFATVKERARAPAFLADTARTHLRGLRVRRRLLQHHPPTLDPGLPLTRPVRDYDHNQHQQGERLAAQARECPKNRVHSIPLLARARGAPRNHPRAVGHER
jgi:putative transposase